MPKILNGSLGLSIGVENPGVIRATIRKTALLDGEFILALNRTSVEYEERCAFVFLPLVQITLNAILEGEWTTCSGDQRLVRVFENQAEVVSRVNGNDVVFQLRGLVWHREPIDESVSVLDWAFESGQPECQPCDL